MEINESTWEQLRQDVGDEVFPMIISSFYQELISRSEKLEIAINSGLIASIGEESHSLKSTARTVGLDLVADCACETETSARAGESEQAIKSAQELRKHCGVAITVLSERIEQPAQA